MKEAIVIYNNTSKESLELAIELLEKEEAQSSINASPNDRTRAINDLKWMHREIERWEELQDGNI